jgi:hypothetical protein
MQSTMNYLRNNWKTTVVGIMAAIAHVLAYGAGGKWAAIGIALLGLVASDAKSAQTPQK